jgi:hypothetical protein
MKYSSDTTVSLTTEVSMVTFGHPPLRGSALAAALLGLLWSPTDIVSAPTTRAQGISQQARVIARSEVPLGSMVTGFLESLFRVLKSADPHWNDAQVFSVQFSDPEMRQSQVRRGQMIVIHADGDRTFLEYEFTWKPGGGTMVFELKGRFLGGTGKFANITGRWRERRLSTMTEDMSEWEVEYQGVEAHSG